MSRTIVLTESQVSYILDEDVIGYDWKTGRDGRLINPGKKTNSQGSDDVSWIIADKIKIIKILTDDEIDQTNREYFKDKPKTYLDNKKRERLTYYPMPRYNGNRLSADDIERMGFNNEID